MLLEAAFLYFNRRDGKRSRKMKKIKLSTFLNILAAILFIFGLYLIIKPYWQNHLQDELIKDVLTQMGEEVKEAAGDAGSFQAVKEIEVSFRADQYIVSGEAWEDFSNPALSSCDKNAKGNSANPAVNYQKTDYVKVFSYARMDIPAINFSMPVADEATLYSLRLAVGHHKSSARLGEIGNAVFFAHRGYRSGRYLNNAHEIKAGDEIRVITSSHAYIYKMTKSTEIDPRELLTRLNEPTDKARIILVSCTPLRDTGKVKRGDHRILVYGELWQKIPLN